MIQCQPFNFYWIHKPLIFLSRDSTMVGPLREEITLPLRKRRRPALSCIEWRRRRIKCDRSNPYKNCKRSAGITAYLQTSLRLLNIAHRHLRRWQRYLLPSKGMILQSREQSIMNQVHYPVRNEINSLLTHLLKLCLTTWVICPQKWDVIPVQSQQTATTMRNKYLIDSSNSFWWECL